MVVAKLQVLFSALCGGTGPALVKLNIKRNDAKLVVTTTAPESGKLKAFAFFVF